MNRFDSYRRWTIISAGLVLAGFAGFYFFHVSAQTEKIETPAEQNLVNGRLAFNHDIVGPGPERSVITTNADGTGSGGISALSGHWPFNPAWSPDGTRIAYESTGTTDLGEIWATNTTGGPTNLTNTGGSITEVHPSWSATGKIAYERAGQIWTMNADGTGQAQFVAITQAGPSRPAWSPDGLKLAFSSGGNIWVINADGTNQVQVTTAVGTETDPTWSPDGSKIAFTKGTTIAIINANGTNEIPLPVTTSKEPAWSPDGTRIAYRGSNGLYIMDVDGSNQVRIYADVINFPLCCDHHYGNPAWQPVAQTPNTFIISGRITDNNGVGVGGATINLTGTTNAATTTDAIGNYQFSGLTPGGSYQVSPSMLNRYFTPANRTFSGLDSNKTANFSGSRVCVGLICAQNGKIAFERSGEIFTMNADGTNQTNITNNPSFDAGPDWSPDGVKLIFNSDRDGNTEIYRKNSEDDPPIRLTNNPASDNAPRYSPNGESIVFVSNRDGNSEIYKMKADGTDQVRLTNEPEGDSSPSFSPDGGKILFIRRMITTPFSSSLYTMNTDGTNQQPIFGPVGFLVSPSYSPDGTKIILVFGADATQQTIYVLNVGATIATATGFGRSQPAWSPDGTRVVHNCCFATGPNFANGLFASAIGGPIGQRLTSLNEIAPDWQPRPVPRRTAFDFDGDGRTDLSYFRPSDSGWYLLRSTEGLWIPVWGLATDVIAPGDYDGDLKTDLAVWRESDNNFYVLNSFDFSVRVENFGLTGDIPTGGDFDGDGKTDVAVYRPGGQGVLYYRPSMGNPQGNITFVPWGATGDKPVVGDYDGDGRTDTAVYRPSTGIWYVLKSSDGQLSATHFGIASDSLIPADYDGDGKTDLAVFRSGVWYLMRSLQGFAAFQFGISGDVPAPGDYDGDGHADPTVFRAGVWWSLRSVSGGVEAHGFGTTGDKPIPSVFVR